MVLDAERYDIDAAEPVLGHKYDKVSSAGENAVIVVFGG